MRYLLPPVLLVAIGLGHGPAAAAAAKVPPLKPGMSYASARGVLIEKGFHPVRSGDQRDDRCSAGRRDVCVAYPETVSCDGTGAAACRFIFTSGEGLTLTVVADGNDAGHLRVVTTRRASKQDAAWQRASR